MIKPKSKMVVRGFGQVHNVDFYETFAATPSAASVKIAVAVVNEKGWLLWHIDIKQTFIQVHLDESVYTRLPAGCGDIIGEVVLLHRAVYGLRQTGRQWSLWLSRVLLQKPGMQQSKDNSCAFSEVVHGAVTHCMCSCVDGLAATAKDKETFDALYAQFKESFPINDRSNPSWYLGCVFERYKMRTLR